MSAGQRVRVTIEGVAEKAGHCSDVLRIKQGNGSVVYVDTSDDAVTVEDVTPTRTWTDGDVLQNRVYGWTLTRTGGMWLLSNGKNSWADGDVNDSLTDAHDPYHFELTVLRYQAGE